MTRARGTLRDAHTGHRVRTIPTSSLVQRLAFSLTRHPPSGESWLHETLGAEPVPRTALGTA